MFRNRLRLLHGMSKIIFPRLIPNFGVRITIIPFHCGLVD